MLDSPAVEAQAGQAGLQYVDVVAAQVGGDELEVAVAEAPRGLDEGQPGGLVATAVLDQATLALEGTHAGGRCRTERPGIVVVRAEPDTARRRWRSRITSPR